MAAQLEALAANTYIDFGLDKSGNTRQQLTAAESNSVYSNVLAAVNEGGLGAKVVPLGEPLFGAHQVGGWAQELRF